VINAPSSSNLFCAECCAPLSARKQLYCSPRCRSRARDARKYQAQRDRRRAQGAWTTEGFVYFVQEGDDGPIKIGWASDLVDRLERLQTGNPRELRIIASLPGSRATEAVFHQRFADRRIRNEWFDIDAETVLRSTSTN
jgi:hypothetical protein